MSKVDDFMTLSAWGLTHGMTRQGAHDAAKRYGFPRREDGKVSKAVCDALYSARARPRVKSKPAPAEGNADGFVTYSEARRREAVARAVMAEREAALQAGELLRVEQVRNTWGILLNEAKQRLLSMPSRLAPLVHAVTQAQAHEAIRKEVYEVLTDLSRSDGTPAHAEDGRP